MAGLSLAAFASAGRSQARLGSVRLDVPRFGHVRLGSVRWGRFQMLRVFGQDFVWLTPGGAGQSLEIVELFSPPRGDHVVVGSWIFHGFSIEGRKKQLVAYKYFSSERETAFHSPPSPTQRHSTLHFPFLDHETRQGKNMFFLLGFGQASAGLSQVRRAQARLDSARLGWLNSARLGLNGLGSLPLGSACL